MQVNWSLSRCSVIGTWCARAGGVLWVVEGGQNELVLRNQNRYRVRCCVVDHTKLSRCRSHKLTRMETRVPWALTVDTLQYFLPERSLFSFFGWFISEWRVVDGHSVAVGVFSRRQKQQTKNVAFCTDTAATLCTK